MASLVAMIPSGSYVARWRESAGKERLAVGFVFYLISRLAVGGALQRCAEELVIARWR